MRQGTIVQKLVENITCDDCGEPTNLSSPCQFCKKDLCENHRFVWPVDIYGEDNGDYFQTVCGSCDEISKVYREQIDQIRTESDQKIERLVDRFKSVVNPENKIH